MGASVECDLQCQAHLQIDPRALTRAGWLYFVLLHLPSFVVAVGKLKVKWLSVRAFDSQLC